METTRPVLSDCIEWDKARSASGYGLRWFRGKLWRAHRAAYTEQVRELLPGELLRHSCDNKCCINVLHLIPGNKSENAIDASLRGHRHRQLKLTADNAREIITRLDQGESQTSLAKEFRVSKHAVHNIKRGHAWSHITGVNNEQS